MPCPGILAQRVVFWQACAMKTVTLTIALLPLTGFLALPLGAETAIGLTARQFEDYTTGKVLTYGFAGAAYGIEQYLPGRKVVWAFVGGECRTGSWYEADKLICFVYDDRPDDPQCWSFFLRSTGLQAHFAGDPEDQGLIEVEQSSGPMPCAGPDLGV